MARKKKKTRAKPTEAADQEEVEDELVALFAIFPDTELDSDERGLELTVRPHHGDADASYVSATLHLRCYTIVNAEFLLADAALLRVLVA